MPPTQDETGVPDSGDKKPLPVLAITVAALLVALLLLFFAILGSPKFLSEKEPMQPGLSVDLSPDVPATIGAMRQLHERGDYARAADVAKRILSENPPATPEEDYNSRVTVANILFNQGGVENEEASIATQKAVALDEAAPAEVRAAAINNLASYFYEDRDPSLFEKIFSGAWAYLAEGGDEKLALRKLSELSYSLSPNIGALLRINYWYNSQLIDYADAITEAERQAYLKAIRDNLEEVDTMAARVYGENPTRNSGYANYLHRRAFTEAVLAMVGDDKDYARKFKEHYETIIAIYDGEVARVGATRIIETIPYTYFYYASFLDELYGLKERRKVESLIADLIRVVENNRDKLGARGFTTFLREEWERPAAAKDHNYRFFMKLADISPEFKEFLKKEGWRI